MEAKTRKPFAKLTMIDAINSKVARAQPINNRHSKVRAIPRRFYIFLFIVFLGIAGAFTFLLQTVIAARNNPTKMNITRVYNKTWLVDSKRMCQNPKACLTELAYWNTCCNGLTNLCSNPNSCSSANQTLFNQACPTTTTTTTTTTVTIITTTDTSIITTDTSITTTDTIITTTDTIFTTTDTIITTTDSFITTTDSIITTTDTSITNTDPSTTTTTTKISTNSNCYSVMTSLLTEGYMTSNSFYLLEFSYLNYLSYILFYFISRFF